MEDKLRLSMIEPGNRISVCPAKSLKRPESEAE